MFEKIDQFKKLKLSFLGDNLKNKEKKITEKLTQLVRNNFQKITEILKSDSLNDSDPKKMERCKENVLRLQKIGPVSK